MHLDNLLFILLIAMAALFRLLASKAGETKKKLQNPDQKSTISPQLGESPRRAPVESDEERNRKFLEALGQPATSRPPPPVVPRTNIPPRPVAPVQPPLPQAWKVIREGRRKPDVIRGETPPLESARRVEKIFPPAIPGVPAFEVHEGPLPVEPPPIIKTSVEAYA